MELTKELQALRKIMLSVGRPELFDRILTAKSKKQRHDTVIYAFKMLSSDLPKDDISVLRQLTELVAQVPEDDLRTQLETVLSELFSSDQKSIPARIGARILRKQRPVKFDLTPKQQQKPRAFNWNMLHRKRAR